MNEVSLRMTDGGQQPNEKHLLAWLGKASYSRWTRLCKYIETAYPDIFVPKWLFGGQKHGWGLRFKKSKSFCWLIPERNRFLVLIVFGEAERKKAEMILDKLSRTVRGAYKKATTYHDGKWLVLAVERNEMLHDVQRLLTIKRRPKITSAAKGQRRPRRNSR